jgi:hypothetical protein
MGQPSHPNGSRVNSVQVADNSISWSGADRAFYFQAYLLSVLFKFIRHWLTASLVIPYQTPWYNGKLNRLARLRSRRAKAAESGVIPDLEWANNEPRALKKPVVGRVPNGVVMRYFRKLPSVLILRDSVEDLVRPAIVIKRPRYAFTFWNRPRLLRCTGATFCLLKGVGAGEKTPKPFPPKKWQVRVKRRGAWKKTPLISANKQLTPTLPYWKLEI